MYARRTLLAKLAAIPLRTETGPWNRAVAHRYLVGPPPGLPPGSPPRPLWPGGAKLFGQRFTPKGSFETTYIASDSLTALMEVRGILAGAVGLISPPSNPWVIVAITGVVHSVLDTTDPTVQFALGTSVAELTGSWAHCPAGTTAPTQVLGEAAYASRRVHGIKDN